MAKATKEQLQERMKKARAAAKAKRDAAKLAAQQPVAVEPQEQQDEAPAVRATTAPWKPARMLDIPDSWKDPRFRYRWVRNDPPNVAKKLRENWVIDHELSRRLNDLYGLPATIRDATPSGSTMQVRELIVMKMPVETAESRNAYYAERANMTERVMKRNLQGNMSSDGTMAPVYGERTEEREFRRR